MANVNIVYSCSSSMIYDAVKLIHYTITSYKCTVNLYNMLKICIEHIVISDIDAGL